MAVSKEQVLTFFFNIFSLDNFFDSSNLATQYKLYQDLNIVNQEKEFYLNEIAKNKNDMQELMSNLTNLEQYGRERYLMKKDDEDIFIVIKKDATTLKSK